MKKAIFIFAVVSSVLIMGFVVRKESFTLDRQMSVREALITLEAYDAPNHVVNEVIRGASAEKGKEIVTLGSTKGPTGLPTRRISKHFVCTSCHNIEREDPDLAVIDPQARLEYTAEKGIPFLQGSPLYGIVNRDSFYNDDYEKKYGDLVFVARNNLRQAIQLCSTECSQGRLMNDWEVESVLMYLWTLELKLEDLNIDTQEEEKIARAIENNEATHEIAELIKSKYMVTSPAHFVAPPVQRAERATPDGDAENGAIIYENSCMYCHDNRRYSFFNLDYSDLTFRNLRNNLDEYHERSIYQVARYGTSPVAGKKAYMPQYTVEKMSEQMLEDLKTFIIRKAN
ncbi:c-type cytochrome [Portibacter marinus]|uniref:c-type cytochrome n=1 Tax=Portibacter marinus TaxID=2898660 RepID=UPI001F2D46E6|nr:c-type cytochrome [Portibacter marinus]